MERFNYEEFDYDNVYKEVLENIKKPQYTYLWCDRGWKK